MLGVGKGVLFREVSSVQRLKEWYSTWGGKGVLFSEVSSDQECPMYFHFRGSSVPYEPGGATECVY